MKCPACGQTVRTVRIRIPKEAKDYEMIVPHKIGWFKGWCPASERKVRDWTPICERCHRKIGAAELAYSYPGELKGSLDITSEKLMHRDCLSVTEHVEEPTSERLRYSTEFIVRKDFARALSILEGFLDPSDPTDWYNKGNVLRNLSRPLEAVAAFDEALFLDTHYVKAWYRKGQALGEATLTGVADKMQDSTKCFENVLTLEKWLKSVCDGAIHTGNFAAITEAVKQELSLGLDVPGTESSVVLQNGPPLGLLREAKEPGGNSWSQAALICQVWALIADANKRTLDSRLGKISQPSPDEHQRILEKIGFAYFVLHAYPTLATRLPHLTSAKGGFEALRVTIPDFIIPNLKDILAVLEPPESVRIIQPGYRH